ncbi:MAG: M28 family peptidase [Armatimonadota bacterium]|nr:M28 family peptidase [Armatimonadota bacterium]MDR7485784.1 M28 family peptidase [Armatimonadota bacterium]MDR7532080.1 M28 family peptidase [Armatimonadota bacterium]MDR7537524.1 M28 family peptidase [Armatimonadota bacterium]
MHAVSTWRNDADEQALVAEVSLDEPWALVERFTTLVRESGTRDERRAFDYISRRLKQFGVPHTVHTPTLLISLPRRARLEVLTPERRTLVAKTPSMSLSTGGRWKRGELVYVPTGTVADIREIFAAARATTVDVRGRIALTEGYASPGKVFEFMKAGAVAAVFISPGERIHEGICTTIWGSPDLDSWERKPTIPVVMVNKTEGAWLKQLAQAGPVRARLSTKLVEGWVACPVCVAEIPGTQVPEEFVLVHGHVDGWHQGIGDNATGDATLLELARVLWKHRSRLARTVRIAWWPGHSQGRYAGSAWYADAFALDLDEHCVAHINCDSPGCRWATVYVDVFWMSEAEGIGRAVIKDVTGQEASGGRPLRAGDKSFSNIGISTFYMLSSTMPPALVREKGYYPVGGCGANIAWHTEDDTIEIADRDNLLRDIKVYLVAAYRTANATLHPLDFTALAAELEGTLQAYQEATGGEFDLRAPLAEARALRADLERWYLDRAHLLGRSPADPDVRRANATLRRLARILVPINYSRAGRFRHDPAVDVPPLPDLAPAKTWKSLEPGTTQYFLTMTHLVRGRNRVTAALRAAREVVAS